jgi:hypothetical protein
MSACVYVCMCIFVCISIDIPSIPEKPAGGYTKALLKKNHTSEFSLKASKICRLSIDVTDIFVCSGFTPLMRLIQIPDSVWDRLLVFEIRKFLFASISSTLNDWNNRSAYLDEHTSQTMCKSLVFAHYSVNIIVEHSYLQY